MVDDDRQLAELHQELYEMENQAVVSFFSDLADAKRVFPKIPRNRIVRVWSKRTQKEYTFAYAPLETILAAVEKPLHEKGFSISQREVHEGELSYVETVLAHKSGHSISGRTRILIVEDGPQAYGSALTYARRYGVTLLLCLATDEDDDANLAEGNEATKAEKAPIITEKQANDLVALATEVGANIPAFLKYFGVEGFNKIPASRYHDAVTALEKKRQAA
jgi:hypothetical protein